jgi:hypothetical protein
MGEGDLFPSPHEQSIGGIGPTTQRRGGPPMPLCPLWSPCSIALKDAQVASPVTSHTHRRTDQSLAPNFLADEGAPQPARHKRTPPCLFAGIPPLQPRCRERCARAPQQPCPACERARKRKAVTEIVEPPPPQRWLPLLQRTSQKGPPHTPTPIQG